MGDSRSWAADKEDEIVTCKYGNTRKYFDKNCGRECQCALDNARYREDRFKAECLTSKLVDVILSLPEEDRKNLTVGVRTKHGWITPKN
jgi:hypothetical protein